MNTKKECTVEKCKHKEYLNGYCRQHYIQMAKYGKITISICSIDGCDKPSVTKGYCSSHYYYSRKSNKEIRIKGNYISRATSAIDTINKVYRKCSVARCSNKHYANGYCSMHNYQVKKYGRVITEFKEYKGCLIDNCRDRHYGKGYCRKHYTEIRNKKNSSNE